jgi:hypothetical protein
MKTVIKISIIITFLFSILSCEKENPLQPIQKHGLSGIIMDSAGMPIQNVKIYCYYNFIYVPNPPKLMKEKFNINIPSSFGFGLYQNFPNPVYDGTFLRFSIPHNTNIELTIKNELSGTIVYRISEFYNYGYYQFYLQDIVPKLNLENGKYLVTLKAKRINEPDFVQVKNLYVVSDLGLPNAISDNRGFYYFNYNKSFIGDTVIVASNDVSYTFTNIIKNEINLVFKKEGYKTEFVKVRLFPSLLINRDVILIKE